MFKIFNKRKEDIIIDFTFFPTPKAGHRYIEPDDFKKIINKKTEETELMNKLDYPSIVYESFEFNFKTCDIDFSFNVDKDYYWNNADIYGILQLLANCSKDDRRVIYGSLIHDYMLENKVKLFQDIKKKYPGITIDRFRHLTSNLFVAIIISQGMTPWRAKMMGFFVDIFQKYVLKSKWNELYEYLDM